MYRGRGGNQRISLGTGIGQVQGGTTQAHKSIYRQNSPGIGGQLMVFQPRTQQLSLCHILALQSQNAQL